MDHIKNNLSNTELCLELALVFSNQKILNPPSAHRHVYVNTQNKSMCMYL